MISSSKRKIDTAKDVMPRANEPRTNVKGTERTSKGRIEMMGEGEAGGLK